MTGRHGSTNLTDEFFVLKPFPHDAFCYECHLVYRVHLSDIMSSSELGNVTLQVLRRYFVIGSVVSPFQSGPEAFDSVCMSHSLYILTYAVIHALIIPNVKSP